MHATSAEVATRLSLARKSICATNPKNLQSVAVWEGCIQMFSVKKFAVTAYAVSGHCENLSKILSDPTESRGCLVPESVWDYIDTIWSVGAKEMCMVRFAPAGAKESRLYAMLYSYLNCKQRYGIIYSKCSTMDAVLIPLPAFQLVPARLRPTGGPGLEANHPNLLLVLILPKKESHEPLLEITKEKKKKKVTFQDQAPRDKSGSSIHYSACLPRYRNLGSCGAVTWLPYQKVSDTPRFEFPTRFKRAQEVEFLGDASSFVEDQTSLELPNNYFEEIIQDILSEPQEPTGMGSIPQSASSVMKKSCCIEVGPRNNGLSSYENEAVSESAPKGIAGSCTPSSYLEGHFGFRNLNVQLERQSQHIRQETLLKKDNVRENVKDKELKDTYAGFLPGPLDQHMEYKNQCLCNSCRSSDSSGLSGINDNNLFHLAQLVEMSGSLSSAIASEGNCYIPPFSNSASSPYAQGPLVSQPEAHRVSLDSVAGQQQATADDAAVTVQQLEALLQLNTQMRQSFRFHPMDPTQLQMVHNSAASQMSSAPWLPPQNQTGIFPCHPLLYSMGCGLNLLPDPASSSRGVGLEHMEERTP
nr:PREDICTED: PHD finger protein 3-like [Latimeria chalumnae]|eukprot:XP_014348339.1 PREDICTED: PHD finger protein 3-like [Latimeria chalumnae]